MSRPQYAHVRRSRRMVGRRSFIRLFMVAHSGFAIQNPVALRVLTGPPHRWQRPENGRMAHQERACFRKPCRPILQCCVRTDNARVCTRNCDRQLRHCGSCHSHTEYALLAYLCYPSETNSFLFVAPVAFLPARASTRPIDEIAVSRTEHAAVDWGLGNIATLSRPQLIQPPYTASVAKCHSQVALQLRAGSEYIWEVLPNLIPVIFSAAHATETIRVIEAQPVHCRQLDAVCRQYVVAIFLRDSVVPQNPQTATCAIRPFFKMVDAIQFVRSESEDVSVMGGLVCFPNASLEGTGARWAVRSNEISLAAADLLDGSVFGVA